MSDSRTFDDVDPMDLDLTYTEAVEELDDILERLESSAVDVDVLADQVARGALLVRYCRRKLEVVRSDVDAVVDDLVDDDNGADSGAGTESGNGGPVADPSSVADRTGGP